MEVTYDHFLLNGYWTRVAVCGDFQPGTLDKLEPNNATNILVILISGNPGICDFYEEFVALIYDKLKSSHQNAKIAIWVPGHAAHCVLPDELRLQSRSDVPLLGDQIEHKLDFLSKFVPSEELLRTNTKVFLVGHSIGCYIVLNMLDELTSRSIDVSKAILLFPVFERTRETKMGRKFALLEYSFIRYVYFLVLFILCSIVCQWNRVQNFIIDALYGREEKDLCKAARKAGLQMFNFAVLRCALMTGLHVVTVININAQVSLIEKHLSRLLFYYSSVDHWTPLNYYEELAKAFPAAQVYLCDSGVKHAFVKTSRENEIMAVKTVAWIEATLPPIE